MAEDKITASNLRAEPITILGDNNRIVNGKRYTVDLSDGNTLHVDVPNNQATVAHIKALIDEQVEIINQLRESF